MKQNYRRMQIRADNGPKTIDEEARSVSVIAATESPVAVYDWDKGRIDEILLMSGASFGDQVPLLNTHSRYDLSDVIGSFRDINVSDGALVGQVVYSDASEDAREAWEKTKEGHLTDYSVGYTVDSATWIPDGEKAIIDGQEFEGPVSVVTDWRLMELSAVPIGADQNAKARAEKPENIREILNEFKEEIMEKKDTPPVPDTPTVDVTAEREKAITTERERFREISAIADQYPQIADKARKAISDGTSLDQFRAEALELIADAKPVEKPADIGMGKRDLENYSFIRAIRALESGRPDGAGLEMEASRAVADQMRSEPRGLFIPMDVLSQKRDMTVGSDSGGGYTVMTSTRIGSFIDLLQNKMVLKQLGITMLSGLVGDIAIPKQTGGSTMYWVSESEDLTESTPSLGQVLLTPKTAGGYVDISRKLMKQSSLDIEMFVRRDLARSLALGFDLAGFHGTGLENQPRGLENVTGINTHEIGTNGGALDWGGVIDMETEISVDNADLGSMAYVTNSKVRGSLKQTEKASGTAQWIWNGNEMNGHRALASNQIKSNYTKGSGTSLSAMFFGDWSQLIWGSWGAIDLTVSREALLLSGGVRVVAFNDVDFNVRNPEAFCLCDDIVTTV